MGNLDGLIIEHANSTEFNEVSERLDKNRILKQASNGIANTIENLNNKLIEAGYKQREYSPEISLNTTDNPNFSGSIEKNSKDGEWQDCVTLGTKSDTDGHFLTADDQKFPMTENGVNQMITHIEKKLFNMLTSDQKHRLVQQQAKTSNNPNSRQLASA